MTDHSRQPTAPRPSATVVLLRDGASGPEVLLVLRHERASFGASYVFPGGVNDAGDSDVYGRCTALTDAAASARLQLSAGGLDYYSSAIRELFEETGILLARRPGRDGMLEMVGDNACDDKRERLNSGALLWAAFLEKENLMLACDRLHYFAYWVTPRLFSKRYSTRFFVAKLPPGQDACHDGSELTDSCWLRPADALAEAEDDKLILPPPTRATLKSLVDFQSIGDVIGWAEDCQQRGVNCILPAILGGKEDKRVVLPGSPDYPPDHRDQQA